MVAVNSLKIRAEPQDFSGKTQEKLRNNSAIFRSFQAYFLTDLTGGCILGAKPSPRIPGAASLPEFQTR
jgi:hypothetical protein